MSNAYDKANELAKLIEQDKNYIMVKNLTNKVMTNPEKMNLIDNFRKKQLDLQQMQMEGKDIDESKVAETNKLYEEMSSDDEIKQLIDAEERLSILFSDINRIITGPLEKIYRKTNEENK